MSNGFNPDQDRHFVDPDLGPNHLQRSVHAILWTEICEINQNFKGDLIKYCEIFTKITLELPQNNLKSFILMYETYDKHNKV